MRNNLILLTVIGVAGLASAAELVSNPGFETLTDKQGIADWSFWTREKDMGSVEVSAEHHAGERGLHIIYNGEKDFALSNARHSPVKPGESYKITCWMKRNSEAKAGSVNVVGLKGDKLVDWIIGKTAQAHSNGWTECKSWFTVPESVDTAYVRITGAGKTDFWLDDVQVEPGIPPAQVKGPKVNGWAQSRPVEPMGRGLVVVQVPGGVYLSWRLLKDDPADIAFDVFKATDGQRVRLNTVPVVQTTDFTDTNGFTAASSYTVTPSAGFRGAAQSAKTDPEKHKTPYIRIPLSITNATVQKVGVGDLDGDGVYDYVIKQSGENIDPWGKYWHKSQETFKLEAHKSDGTLLWIKDLGWNIEHGIWYSPMIVCDLNGDGRAEVAAKIAPDEDFRDADGRVQKGPEWVAVFDGLTGREIARAPWPSREGFEEYNLASRNQLAVAYLDGKTPCLITLRGTYGLMLAEAWQLKDGKLERLWSFSNKELGGKYQGQGAHNCLCADIDNDGREELILGSLALDDDGSVLWTTGKGHPDAHYYGDIDPRRPGMEIAYIIETRQRKDGGIHLIDPVTGQFLWQLGEPTMHVHSSGMCSDIDPMQAGLEIYGADSDDHKLTEHRWLFSSDGKVLKSGKDLDLKFGIPSAWWDADLQRELVRGQMLDYEGGVVSEKIEGDVILVADVIGDWREEVFTTVKGEMRIYTTPVPAMDRRICLMQDGPYRMRTMMNAMGYFQVPILSYVAEALAPNLNLTVQKDGRRNVCRVVVVAPLDKGVKGTLALTAPKDVKLSKTFLTIDLKASERVAEVVDFEGSADRGDAIAALLTIEGSARLCGRVPLGL